MILTDEITLYQLHGPEAGYEPPAGSVQWERVIPANVVYKDTRGAYDNDMGSGATVYGSAVLIAQFEPLGSKLHPGLTRVKWRDEYYRVNGPARIARRHGRDHHWQIELRGQE